MTQPQHDATYQRKQCQQQKVNKHFSYLSLETFFKTENAVIQLKISQFHFLSLCNQRKALHKS